MDISEIVRHPKTFLKSNALWPSGMLNVLAKGKPDIIRAGQADEGSKVWPVQLLRKPGVRCKRGDMNLPCWEIAPATSHSMHLAYYLPWTPNSMRSLVLGDKADFFITDTMNGCTFAFGPGGFPRVAHVNFNTFDEEGVRKEGNPIDQIKMNDEIRKIMPAGPLASLKKENYKTGNFPNVTVIGVRRNGRWEFIYQKRDYIGSTDVAEYKWLAVHTIR